MPANRRQLLTALLAGAVAAPLHAQQVVEPWPAQRAVPPLVADDLQGHSWNLGALGGRPVLLNFWATWCGPCRQEMPTLQALAEHEPGLQVLALNVRERAPRVRRYLQSANLRLTVLLDPFGEITHAWSVNVFPTTVLIAPDGRPMYSVRGALDWTGAAASGWIRSLAA